MGAELDSVALLRLTAPVAAVIALPALAHEGGAGTIVTTAMRWSFEPWVVALLATSAVFYATSPSEFALRVQGVAGTSDTSWKGFESDDNS